MGNYALSEIGAELPKSSRDYERIRVTGRLVF
jgi:hypothetical protein